MKCPYCGKNVWVGNDIYLYGELRRDQNGYVYNKIDYECFECGKTFHTKTVVGFISNDDMKKSIDNTEYMKIAEYEIGCRATGYVKNTIEVPVGMSYSEIEKLVKEKEDVDRVSIYEFCD